MIMLPSNTVYQPLWLCVCISHSLLQRQGRQGHCYTEVLGGVGVKTDTVCFTGVSRKPGRALFSLLSVVDSRCFQCVIYKAEEGSFYPYLVKIFQKLKKKMMTSFIRWPFSRYSLVASLLCVVCRVLKSAEQKSDQTKTSCAIVSYLSCRLVLLK